MSESLKKNSEFSIKLVISLLVILTFGRSLLGEYVTWDDNIFIFENRLLNLPFLEALAAFFSRFYHGDYIPIPLASYLIETKIFGLNPFPQHITQLILHLVNTWLLFEIVKQFYQRQKGRQTAILFSSTITLFFALHPVQTEVVAWISERKGILSTLFLLLSLRAYLRFESTWNLKTNFENTRFPWQIFCTYLGFYTLSLLSKFTGVLLPLLMMVRDWLYFPGRFRQNFWQTFRLHLPLLIVGLALSWVRIFAYGQSVAHLEDVMLDPSRFLLLPAFILCALGKYISLYLFPINLSAVYPIFTFSQESWFFGGVALLITGFVIWSYRRNRNPDVIFFSMLTLFFLAPVLQIVPRINFINDRYLYLPIIGMTGIWLAILEPLWRRMKPSSPLPSFLLGTVLTLLPGLSFQRAGVWLNDLTLWSDTVQKNPSSSIAHNNLAMVYQKSGLLSEAVREYEQVLTLGKKERTDNLAYNNLGVIYSNPENQSFFDPAKAISYLNQGIQASEKREDTYTLRFNMALAYLRSNQKDQAISILRDLENEISSRMSDQKYLYVQDKVQALLNELSHPGSENQLQEKR